MLPKDKDDVVRPPALNDGLVVWSDGFELRIGNSLRRIDQGLANSHSAWSLCQSRSKAGRTTKSTESPLGLSNGSNSFYPSGISRPKHCYPTRLTISDLITSVIAAQEYNGRLADHRSKLSKTNTRTARLFVGFGDPIFGPLLSTNALRTLELLHQHLLVLGGCRSISD